MFATRTRLILALALVALTCPAAARAEDPVETAPTSWRVDVRVVQVTTERAMAESAPTLPGIDEHGRTTASWADILAALKRRGDVRVRMDRSLSTSPGIECRATAYSVETVMVEQSNANGMVQRGAVPMRESADANLKLHAGAAGSTVVEYGVKLAWLHRPSEQAAPIAHEAEWRATAAAPGSGALVLRHAEQGAQDGATEIYVMLSWRR